VQRHFWERRGHRGGGSARGKWRRQRPVRLPEEEDGRPTDRVGPPVSEEEVVGQAGPEGAEGVERWAAAGSEAGNGWIKSFQILFGIWIFGRL
jgi:hypothetical protein